MKRLLLNTKVSKIYIISVILITLLLLASYYSYAMFTVSKEKNNAISIVTGTLSYDLKIDGVSTDEIVVNALDTATFTVTLSNPNERIARFNFYYIGEVDEGVKMGYLEGDNRNIPPNASGVNLTAKDSIGSVNTYLITVFNSTLVTQTIKIGVQVGLDYNNLSLPSDGHLFQKYDLLADEALKIKATLDDDVLRTKELYLFSQEKTMQTDQIIDYRYIGSEPNNYIYFNDELWRIIGVFTVDDGTGKEEERLKIMSNTGIYGVSFDNTGEYGNSDFVNSSLNHLLNEGHENEEIGGSLYWNRASGICYNGINNATSTCDFTTVGLLDDAKKMIDNSVWYLGGVADIYVTPIEFYNYERGNLTYNNERQISWTGKVGLIYPSDYGFATSGGANTSREECYNNYLYSWASDCYNNNWIYKIESNMKVTITASSEFVNRIFHVNNAGYLTTTYPYYSDTVFPTVYLKQKIIITNGNGSLSDPYQLELL